MALNEIIAHKRTEIAERAERRPLESFIGQLTPSDRGLRGALARPGARFIMEYKKASPSRGAIRGDLSPEDVAGIYGGVADAISVLVDERFFAGSLAYLRAIRDRVSQPVLCKDVVVSPYQVYEARLHGADAVLLMLSVLDDDEYRTCAAIARRFDLDVVTEVHDEDETRRAVELGAPIIGINNRDLRTLKVDIAVTERLASLVPEDRLVISESGIHDHRDVRRLARHANAFLVGTSLMGDRRIDLAARRLVHGRVKVCGHAVADGLQSAWQAGAVYGGLIFAERSSRYVDLARAGELAASSPMPLVGVFVDQPADEIEAAVRECGLEVVQLHGGEDADFIAKLRRRLPGDCAIWKALRVSGTPPAELPGEADRVLLDTYVPRMCGGTGQRFDWRDLATRRDKDRIVLAGGLDAGNAAEAAGIGAWALDVNSGVERAPGVKDATRLARFFAALRPSVRGDKAVTAD
ncbi:MAG: bifunctional indole-3-glycerol-phosphate synthase TrpC/phosphoribosylanthranilate isomerase TrpF [Sphingomonadales bacterium]